MSARIQPFMRLRQGGFSLTELMVALVMSLVLLAGALSILYSSRVSYAENEKLARVQESGRSVMELVLRDVRASGFNGCARPLQAGDFINEIPAADDEEEALYDFARALGGYEGGGSAGSPSWATAGGMPAFDAAIWPSAPLSDVLIVRVSREGQPSFRTTQEVLSPATPTVQVAFGLGTAITTNSPLMISDCRGSSAFMASDFNVTAAASASAAGLADVEFSTGNLSRGFMPGATIVPLEAIVYYIGTGSGGTGLSLWQKLGTAAAQELVEGVESMQVLYGVDTSADRVPDAYVAASGVTNWDNVVSMQIAVLVRSEQEYGNDVDDRTYALLDANVGPFNDRRLRSVFTTTVAVRNRAN